MQVGASPDGGASDAAHDRPEGNTDTGGDSQTGASPDGRAADAARSDPDGGTGTDDSGGAGDAGCPYVSAASDAGAYSCSRYCASVMAACTGANAQYMDTTSCLTACQYLQPGTPGTAGVTSGDTVACRIAHAGLARAAPNPHCWNAGPFGYGACGEPCEGFCDIAAGMHPQCSLANGFCSPAGGFGSGAPPYSSQGDCILHCALYPRINTSTNLIQPPGMVGLDGGYSANGPATGNTLDCREYHLMSGLRGGAAQQMECPLAGPDSPACR